MIRTMSAKLDSVFKSAEQMFDKTLLCLPASAKLLAKIKVRVTVLLLFGSS